MQAQLHTSERDRLAATAALDEHLSAMRLSADGLRTETGQLVTALRAPQVRGRWGELQLERTVEAAGMVEHVDYVTQPSATGEDGTLRPDLVVRLVGGKHIVIDSKVAFAGYLEAMEARDEATRAARLKAHARHLRTHIEDLGGKAYWRRFIPAPEFVVCFVPGRRLSRRRAAAGPVPAGVRLRPQRHPGHARPRWSRCCAPSATPGGSRRWPTTPRRSANWAASCTSGCPGWGVTWTSSAAR